MRLREQRFWDLMRGALRDKMMLTRVENMVTPGFADVVACCVGNVFMCEMKSVTCPARRDTRVLGDDGCSVAQKNFHMEWNANGGRSLILVRVTARVGNKSQFFAISGTLADYVNDMSIGALTESAAVMASDGPAFWAALNDYMRIK